MNTKITDFVEMWKIENINPEAYDPGHEIISASVAKLTIDAASCDISVNELVNHLGDLSDFISDAMESATDSEVNRLADRDD